MTPAGSGDDAASLGSAPIDFSNWSLGESEPSQVATDDGHVGSKIDFSQWSLDGKGDPAQSASATSGFSDWSLGPLNDAQDTESVDTPVSGHDSPDIHQQSTESNAQDLTSEEWIVLGEDAFGENDLDDAEKCFLTALVLNPISSIALSNLGVVYHTRGNLESAEVCYLKSVAFDQTSADGFYGLAQMWADAGHAGLALRYAARGLRRQPDHHSLAEIAQGLSQHLDGQLAQLHTS